MKLWKWVLNVLSRIGDLVIKLISAKVVAACVVTWYARANPSEANVLIVAIMWALVVGFRYAEKAIGLMKGK